MSDDSLRLNTLPAPPRRRKKRVGRGIGCGRGKTAGRGHKGQRARSGGRRDAGFEGGQMPLHRRVPKRGFRSRLDRRTKSIRLGDLRRLPAETITLQLLRDNGFLTHDIKRVRIFLAGGDIGRAVTVSGIATTRGARAAIESAGGKVV